MLTAAELTELRAVQEDFLPGTAIIQRHTLASDGMGGQVETWVAVGTVSARLYPQVRRATGEIIAGDQLTSLTIWDLTLPHGTSVTAADRILYNNARMFHIAQVNNNEAYQTAVRCELIAYNELESFDAGAEAAEYLLDFSDSANSFYLAAI